MQRVNNGNQFQYQQKQLTIGNAFKFVPKFEKPQNLNHSCHNSNCSSAASSNYDNESSQVNEDSFDDDAESSLMFESNHIHCKKHKSYEEIQLLKSKKKTKLCKNFEMNGTCKYGNMCNYAHGEEQLSKK